MTPTDTPPLATLAAPPPPPSTAPGSDFAVLSRRIVGAGLLRRRPGYYAARIGGVAVLYAAGWTAFAVLGHSWWQLLIAAGLGVMFAQVALVAHDLAHRQVFRLRRPSETAGRIAGNLGVGMSYGWWQDKHTRHHANPNHEDLDPDVDPYVFVWSRGQAERVGGLARFIGARQAFWFFPLLTLEGFNLHFAGARAVFRRGSAIKLRGLEGVLLCVHVAVYLAALLLVLTPWQALAFLAVHQMVFGVYMGCTFAPNHKGMPTITGADERPDFLRRQVLTSRNVRGGLLLEVVLGGLNHQIEHHLFPSMPTPHLRRARVIVRAYCAELGIAYTEAGLIASYAQALRHLHDAGAPLRVRTA
ncbi:acyl-CoA desaturase [Streptomyces sp. SL13]|uniref:Acyl-CoA desaturase n=1 Tax=Streptantibioticus silvisoli TaxID=2705255 RepID=A0AA90H3E0_9ACTN|nr:acyl-CoA desaturase [Streptantibioticus silvisoli]MDI5962032.1 acyl-CoA desaturase [Streptantibioticus silvisoli]MDI5971256.1 acyl-CoA desaturase [Streptantibioticus silvisoli]